MKPNEVQKIATRVVESLDSDFDKIHGRMEGMLVSLNTIIGGHVRIREAIEAQAKPSPALPKLCRDCRYCKPEGLIFKNYRFALCTYPKADDPQTLVDGSQSTRYCTTERKTYGDGKWVVTCGENAQFFTKR